MKIITDFHIHSRFSVATSSTLTPEHLRYWSRLKGINLLGTGDCVHPGWLAELKEKLIDAGNGFFRLRPEYILPEDNLLPASLSKEVHFILTAEISGIYKKNGKVRKIHNLCVFPDIASVEKFQARLERIGNIRSDGRPILGIDSRTLLEMLLESGEGTYLIPAHIWTPWFSVLGSRSGFDSIDECFEDLTRHIVALETGLSSDPPMNRLCTILDRFRLVSNSDAHSPEKLGREANIFDTDFSYQSIYNALKNDQGFLGTIEFFPEEGKYHHDGHRNCHLHWNPLETLQHEGICPVCGKQVTLGVMYRISQLADREDPSLYPGKQTHYSITQLQDLLAELFGVKSRTQKITREYLRLVQELGGEFNLLLWEDIDSIKHSGGEYLAEGIRRLRQGRIFIQEGYDGEFGRIRVFEDNELKSLKSGTLFTDTDFKIPRVHYTLDFNVKEFQELLNSKVIPDIHPEDNLASVFTEPNYTQKEAISYGTGPCILNAGPGSGKTRVIIERIIYLVKNNAVLPSDILALSFSNRAANEIRERLQVYPELSEVSVFTFHALGLSLIEESLFVQKNNTQFTICDDDEIDGIIQDIGLKKRDIHAFKREIDRWKNQEIVEPSILGQLELYNNKLREQNRLDINDLIAFPISLIKQDPDLNQAVRDHFKWILVDEFQDISKGQYELLKLIAPPPSGNVMAVGDPDQSIYGFRGGSAGFMNTFRTEYSSCHEITLNRSYRCPDTVLQAASSVIERDKYASGLNDQMRITVIHHTTDNSEADWIAETIEKSIGGVRGFSRDSGITDGSMEQNCGGFGDFAVLCRASFMFEPLITAFNNHGIAYQVAGEESLLKQEPYKKAVKLFRDIYNNQHHIEKDYPVIAEMISSCDSVKNILVALLDITGRDSINSTRFDLLIQPYEARYDDFLKDITMRRGSDDFDPRAESVSLMTIHSAKGLEFKTVFIPGCEDGIIPFSIFGHADDNIDEEKRLFYVGITRTMNNLYLSNAGTRYFRGRKLNLPPSPFLERIEETLIHRDKRKDKKKNPDSGQLKLFL